MILTTAQNVESIAQFFSHVKRFVGLSSGPSSFAFCATSYRTTQITINFYVFFARSLSLNNVFFHSTLETCVGRRARRLRIVQLINASLCWHRDSFGPFTWVVGFNPSGRITKQSAVVAKRSLNPFRRLIIIDIYWPVDGMEMKNDRSVIKRNIFMFRLPYMLRVLSCFLGWRHRVNRNLLDKRNRKNSLDNLPDWV